MSKKIIPTGLAAVLAVLCLVMPARRAKADSIFLPNTGMADPETFSALYNKWRATQMNSPQVLSLSLIPMGGISTDGIAASGSV